ncbi:MAG TPA: hypothetical protein VHB02_09790 [Acidimicrobiales bacterium]|nr:hypothetical protein [Acidimicrobiales bacterium]
MENVKARQAIADGLLAGAVGGVLSGLPSTVAAARGHSGLLTATRAAGSVLGRPTVPRGVAAHAVLSVGWGTVLSVLWPGPTLRAAASAHRTPSGGPPAAARRATAGAVARAAGLGAVAGVAIAAVDLGVVGRRLPAVRALPAMPQWMDHVAYGAVAGTVLAFRSAHPARPSGSVPSPRPGPSIRR